jgi:hypothetical protein
MYDTNGKRMADPMKRPVRHGKPASPGVDRSPPGSANECALALTLTLTLRRPPIYRRALLLGAITAFIYLAVAGRLRCNYLQSQFPYHLLTADAMIHGQLHLRPETFESYIHGQVRQAQQLLKAAFPNAPEAVPEEVIERSIRKHAGGDLAVVGDRLYTYWPPLPSVAMIPWVALFGPNVSDLLIDALLGATNAAVAYWMFRSVDRSGLRRLSESCCVAMTLLLAFGTVHFYLSCSGTIWYTAQIVTTTAVLLSIIALTARRNSPGTSALAGALFGAAILGRNTLVLAGLFYAVVIWLRRPRPPRNAVRGFAVRAVAFVLPVVAAGLVQMAFNYERFGNPLESGMSVTVETGGEARFVADYRRYGSFHPVYLPTNLYYYLWNWRFPIQDDQRTFDPEGNSMFLITPPLLYLFLAWRQRDGFTLALLCGALPVVAALLLFRATGWFQFGNRYLLDAIPLLLLLVATGMRGRMSVVGGALIILAIVMNTFGTIRFCLAEVGHLTEWAALSHLAAGAVVLILVWTAVWLRSPWFRGHLGGYEGNVA